MQAAEPLEKHSRCPATQLPAGGTNYAKQKFITMLVVNVHVSE